MKTVNVLHGLRGVDVSGADANTNVDEARREALAGIQALFAAPKHKIVCPRFFSEINSQPPSLYLVTLQ